MRYINSILDVEEWIDVTVMDSTTLDREFLRQIANTVVETSPDYGTDWEDFLDDYPIYRLIDGALDSGKVDEENGCEQCWDELREEFPLANDPTYEGPWPYRWIGKRCPHGASESAPPILISRETTKE